MNDETTVLRLAPIVLGRRQRPATSGEPGTETATLVLDAVSETCAQTGAPIVAVNRGPTLEPHSMMGVITYCYTKGVLCASEIEHGMWKDQRLRGACADKIPTARTISRFRRLNRTLIQNCLENALRRVRRALAASTLSQTLACGTADAKPKLARLIKVAPAPGEGTTILIRKEAAQRLENATYLDGELLSE